MPATIDVLLNETIGTINPNVYGHFVEHLGGCIYDGVWVGDQSEIAHSGGICSEIVEALRHIRPSVIRWPGGCFADDYHWEDGVGPPEKRARRVNLHWGQVVESNRFGTHEFIAFCRAVGAEPYLCGNVGSGSPREMRDWVEYCNYPSGTSLSDRRCDNGSDEPFRVKFWGVGNEAWGCGGNFTPEDYAGEYRRFSNFLKDLGGTELCLIACGPDGNNLDWTRRFFHKLKRDFGDCSRIGGYGAHYYCGTAGTATVFNESEWYELLWKALKMEELIVQQRVAMDEFDPQQRIGLIIDEWGTWHPPTPGRNPAFLWQQNTLRDALVAAMTFDIFNRHAGKVIMANIAQAVNVLQALLLSEGGTVVRTPTYHVYDLYQNHQGARSVRTVFDAPSVVFHFEREMKRLPGLCGSASLQGNTLTLTVVNPLLGGDVEGEIRLRGGGAAVIVRETLLTHSNMTAHNTTDYPSALTPSQPRVLAARGQVIRHPFRGQSVTRLEMSLA